MPGKQDRPLAEGDSSETLVWHLSVSWHPALLSLLGLFSGNSPVPENPWKEDRGQEGSKRGLAPQPKQKPLVTRVKLSPLKDRLGWGAVRG